jgi:hypothetical protein
LKFPDKQALSGSSAQLKSKTWEAHMPDFPAIFDFIELPHGIRLEDAQRDWDQTLGKLLRLWKPQEAIRFWETAVKKFLDSLEAETAETILEGLFSLMRTRFQIDPIIIGSNFRENIDGFEAKYQFRSKSGDINVLVKFLDGKMDWEESFSQDVNASLEFKDGRALVNYLFNYLVLQDRDFLKSMTKNEIKVSGNLNYLYKFLFMANHILLEATHQLP